MVRVEKHAEEALAAETHLGPLAVETRLGPRAAETHLGPQAAETHLLGFYHLMLAISSFGRRFSVAHFS